RPVGVLMAPHPKTSSRLQVKDPSADGSQVTPVGSGTGRRRTRARARARRRRGGARRGGRSAAGGEVLQQGPGAGGVGVVQGELDRGELGGTGVGERGQA